MIVLLLDVCLLLALCWIVYDYRKQHKEVEENLRKIQDLTDRLEMLKQINQRIYETQKKTN